MILPITAGVTTAVYNKNMAVDPTQKIPVVCLAMGQLLILLIPGHPTTWWDARMSKNQKGRPDVRKPKKKTKYLKKIRIDSS